MRARHIVVAVDGKLELVLPELASRARSARLQMLATAPDPDVVISRPIYARWGLDYWQQLADGRIVLGGARDFGGDAEWTTDTEPTAPVQAALETLLRDADRLARADHAPVGRDGRLHAERAADRRGGASRRLGDRRLLGHGQRDRGALWSRGGRLDRARSVGDRRPVAGLEPSARLLGARLEAVLSRSIRRRPPRPASEASRPKIASSEAFTSASSARRVRSRAISRSRAGYRMVPPSARAPPGDAGRSPREASASGRSAESMRITRCARSMYTTRSGTKVRRSLSARSMSRNTTSPASSSISRSPTEPRCRPPIVRTSQPRMSGSPSDTVHDSRVLMGTSCSRSRAYGPLPS